jgi:hypothetical protein
MVEARAVIGIADVHAATLADCGYVGTGRLAGGFGHGQAFERDRKMGRDGPGITASSVTRTGVLDKARCQSVND